MLEGEEALNQLESAFPKELSSHALTKECFGGEFDFKKMNFMERLIVKKVVKVDKDTSNIHEDKIEKLAMSINNG